MQAADPSYRQLQPERGLQHGAESHVQVLRGPQSHVRQWLQTRSALALFFYWGTKNYNVFCRRCWNLNNCIFVSWQRKSTCPFLSSAAIAPARGTSVSYLSTCCLSRCCWWVESDKKNKKKHLFKLSCSKNYSMCLIHFSQKSVSFLRIRCYLLKSVLIHCSASRRLLGIFCLYVITVFLVKVKRLRIFPQITCFGRI